MFSNRARIANSGRRQRPAPTQTPAAARRAFVVLPVVLCLFSFDFALSQDALPSSQILQAHVVEAVVQLLAVGPGGRGRNLECSATGFLINDAGYLMTNAHVVEDARRCLKGSPGGKIVARLPASTSETAGAVACDLVGVDEVH